MNTLEVKSVFKSFQKSYQSIDLELAIAFIDESWKAVFAKAILSALKPSSVSVLVDTELFKLLKGRLSIDLFEQLYKILSEGGQLNLDVDSLGSVNIYFAGWTMSYVAYEYGNLARNISCSEGVSGTAIKVCSLGTKTFVEIDIFCGIGKILA